MLTILAGSTGSTTVNQLVPANAPNGITYSVDGLIAGMTAVVAPTSLSASGNVTVSVTVSNSISPGSYPLILRGTDNANGNLVTNTVIELIVPPSLADFPEIVNATEQIPVLDGSGGPTASTITVNSAPGPMLSSSSPTNIYNAWNWNPYGSLQGAPENYTAYSSYDPTLYSQPGAGTPQAWQQVNWVLNHQYGENWSLNPTVRDTQTVIYALLIPGYSTATLTADGRQLLTDAQNYGTYFVPQSWQTVAIVFYASGINPTATSSVADALIVYTVP